MRSTWWCAPFVRASSSPPEHTFEYLENAMGVTFLPPRTPARARAAPTGGPSPRRLALPHQPRGSVASVSRRSQSKIFRTWKLEINLFYA